MDYSLVLNTINPPMSSASLDKSVMVFGDFASTITVKEGRDGSGAVIPERR